MRTIKSTPIISLVNSYVVDSPQPANLSYAWNFGSLLAITLGIQIVTGIFLSIICVDIKILYMLKHSK